MYEQKSDKKEIVKMEENGINDVWKDFVGITPDPPDKRDKCEHCK